jgi:hypothetical protein
VSDHIDCEQRCTIPDGVELNEVPSPRHAWSDVFNCPNDGCGKSFLVRQDGQPEPTA